MCIHHNWIASKFCCAGSWDVYIYLCLARCQASGHDCLVCDNNPVCKPVHSVLELCVTLQVGLHLTHSV